MCVPISRQRSGRASCRSTLSVDRVDVAAVRRPAPCRPRSRGCRSRGALERMPGLDEHGRVLAPRPPRARERAARRQRPSGEDRRVDRFRPPKSTGRSRSCARPRSRRSPREPAGTAPACRRRSRCRRTSSIDLAVDAVAVAPRAVGEASARRGEPPAASRSAPPASRPRARSSGRQ